MMTRQTSSPDVAPRSTRLAPADAAIFETFVVPRYLSLFGELALETIAERDDATLVHFGCRTGYPDRGLAMRLPGARIFGLDESPAAVELARAKAATMRDMIADYRVMEGFPTNVDSSAFSHAIAIHPLAAPEDRAQLIAEMARVLEPGGQIVVALPLRGSFGEVADLLRECALKTDDASLTSAVERAMSQRPTVESLSAEIEEAGFEDVDVTLRPSAVAFPNGRAFLEDPITRLLLMPEFRKNMATDEIGKPFFYVRDAIDKYWSEGDFELSVHVGCATARRV
jgi:SAM-dependent methyltransferase